MKRIHFKTILFPSIFILLLAPAAGPRVAASPAAADPPLSWFSVQGPAFTPTNSTMAWQYDGHNCLEPASTGAFRANINLPDGAVIQKLKFGFYNIDSNVIASNAYIYRYNENGTTTNVIWTPSMGGGTAPGFHSVTAGTPLGDFVVDNSVSTYMFVWNGSTTQHLCFMRVGYTPPSIFGVALPLLQKQP